MPPARADAIVVLGRGVDPDGALPDLAKQRVTRAAELFAWGVAPRLIFSGRCSLMTETEPPRTEAAAMAEYAIGLGIPKRAVILEEESRDTIGNAYFVLRRFLEPNDWMSIRVVTSDFHIQRAAWVFQKVLGLGYDVAFSPSPSELDHASIAARAREESDISTFLMDWLGPIADGDPIGLARLIWQEHPGYAPAPTVSRADIQARIAAIARVHRSQDGGPRGHRLRQLRVAEL
jgi:uncharacterized SAM-binding protein YcdF (DUF218 family)